LLPLAPELLAGGDIGIEPDIDIDGGGACAGADELALPPLDVRADDTKAKVTSAAPVDHLAR
jgi:hypothetical protein